MHHVAIMKKARGLIPKILSGEKTIESRWYESRIAPWDRIDPGDTIYFKNAGEPIILKTSVVSVVQGIDLSEEEIRSLLSQYGSAIGIPEEDISNFFEKVKSKRYIILIFLGKPELVPSFQIQKKGFGLMTAWLTLPDIDSIRL